MMQYSNLHIVLWYICTWIQHSFIEYGTMSIAGKKSLMIPKGESESINLKRTDNTMDKRKGTKGQTTIYKTLHIKLRSSYTNPTKDLG